MKIMRSSRSSIFFAALLSMFAIFCVSTTAQQEKPKQDAPKISEGEAKLGKKMQEGSDVAAKVKLAEEFVKKYPNSRIRSQVARYIAVQIGSVSDVNQRLAHFDIYSKNFTNAGEADYAAPSLIETYAQLKRYDDAFRLASDYLSRSPEELPVRLYLSIEGSNLARGGETKYVAQTSDFAAKGIQIIEAGKKPADLTDADWKTAQTNWLGQLHQSLGFLNFASGKNTEALASFEKATQIDPKDVNNWAMIGLILNRNYQDTALKYSNAGRNEQTELRKKAEVELDKVIELYARVVAMTDGVAAQQNLNSQIRGDLTEYYKFRHNNSTEGLQALIDKYKTQK